MTRHVPERFDEKLTEANAMLTACCAAGPGHFEYGREALPGVRIVRADIGGHILALSLWTDPTDIAEICGDGSFSATDALLAIDREHARQLKTDGVFVDLGQFTRSSSHPGVYYALFDFVSPRQVHETLHRLVPALAPDVDRVLIT
jgi:hypothetical protein